MLIYISNRVPAWGVIRYWSILWLLKPSLSTIRTQCVLFKSSFITMVILMTSFIVADENLSPVTTNLICGRGLVTRLSTSELRHHWRSISQVITRSNAELSSSSSLEQIWGNFNNNIGCKMSPVCWGFYGWIDYLYKICRVVFVAMDELSQ